VFDLHCPAELAIVSDRLLWRHVLMNLIGNAVKFTMHHEQPRENVSPPRVVVRIERDQHDPGMLRVEVSDNGPGIGAADQAFIFSSGLGLHLSAKIVQVLHGQLDLTSPLQVGGRGTRFGAYASRARASPACNPQLTPRPRPCDVPRLQTSPCPAHSCTRSSRDAPSVVCPLTPCP
jgi:C4-dicarboxylate-specific signal transduction histidine kinase